MNITIVIPLFYSKDYIEECLASIQKNTKSKFELILIDNGCPEDSAQLVKKQADKFIENNENLGFGPACNQGVEDATNELIVLLNADTVVEPNWDVPLIEALEDKAVGISAPMYLNKDGTVQEAGGLIGLRGETEFFGSGFEQDDPRINFERTLTYTSAAGIMLRKSDFQRLGGFGSEYKIAYHEDSDLMLKYKQDGSLIKYTPKSKVTHIKSTVIKNPDLGKMLKEVSIENGKVLQKKWPLELSSFPSLAYPKLFPHNRYMARDNSIHNIMVMSDELSSNDLKLLEELAQQIPDTRITILSTSKIPFESNNIEILVGNPYSALKERLCNINSIVLGKNYVNKEILDQINYLQPAAKRYFIGDQQRVSPEILFLQDGLSSESSYSINISFDSLQEFLDSQRQRL